MKTRLGCGLAAMRCVRARAQREISGEPDNRSDGRTRFGGLDDGIAGVMWLIQADQLRRGRYPLGRRLWRIAQARVRRADSSRESHRDTVADATGTPTRQYDPDLACWRAERERERTTDRAAAVRALLGDDLADVLSRGGTTSEAADLVGCCRRTVQLKMAAVRTAMLAAEAAE